MTAIRLTEVLRIEVEAYLSEAAEERFGFLQAKVVQTPDGTIFLPYRMRAVPDDSVFPSSNGYSVSFEVLVDIVNAARLAGDALIEFHNHSGSMPRFSSIDRTGLAEFVHFGRVQFVGVHVDHCRPARPMRLPDGGLCKARRRQPQVSSAAHRPAPAAKPQRRQRKLRQICRMRLDPPVRFAPLKRIGRGVGDAVAPPANGKDARRILEAQLRQNGPGP